MKEGKMKLLFVLVAVSMVAATEVVAQQHATEPTNKIACEKANMKWDPKGGKDGKGGCEHEGAAGPAQGATAKGTEKK
jgi:hypothetical protein